MRSFHDKPVPFAVKHGYLWFLLLNVFLTSSPRNSLLVSGAISCTTNKECVDVFYEGSVCNSEGFCTNPFHDGGCLASLLPDWHMVRVCNSDDPPEAQQNGYCRPPPIEYTEVRIATQAWESAYMSTWILQILFNEILGVPVTVELGKPGLRASFYDVDNSFDVSGRCVPPER